MAITLRLGGTISTYDEGFQHRAVRDSEAAQRAYEIATTVNGANIDVLSPYQVIDKMQDFEGRVFAVLRESMEPYPVDKDGQEIDSFTIIDEFEQLKKAAEQMQTVVLGYLSSEKGCTKYQISAVKQVTGACKALSDRMRDLDTSQRLIRLKVGYRRLTAKANIAPIFQNRIDGINKDFPTPVLGSALKESSMQIISEYMG